MDEFRKLVPKLNIAKSISINMARIESKYSPADSEAVCMKLIKGIEVSKVPRKIPGK